LWTDVAVASGLCALLVVGGLLFVARSLKTAALK
jgi:hypothetical protein